MIDTVDTPKNILHKSCKIVTNQKTQVHPYAEAAYKNLISQPTGVALAANQVNIPFRWYIDLSQRVYVNPVILERSDPFEVMEGCLSVPGVEVKKLRYNKVTLEFTDLLEKLHIVQLEGLEAQVAQHECEHLAGKLITDKKEEGDD